MRHDVKNGVPIGSFYNLPHNNDNGYLSEKSSESFLISMGSYPCEIEYVFNIGEADKIFDGNKVTVKIYQDLSTDEDRLTPEVISKYTNFANLYAETMVMANSSGINIPEAISYENLIVALMQVDGEMWLRRALMLQAAWQALIVVCEKDLNANASEVFYRWLPVLQGL